MARKRFKFGSSDRHFHVEQDGTLMVSLFFEMHKYSLCPSCEGDERNYHAWKKKGLPHLYPEF
jgi:hypothetical protein